MSKLVALAACAAIVVVAITVTITAIDRTSKDLQAEQACIAAGGTWKLGFFHHTKCKLPRHHESNLP